MLNLNFLQPKSRLVLGVIVFTATSAIALVAPVRAENTTINEEQSTYISPNPSAGSQELIELVNSDNLKFSFLEQTYDFTPAVFNSDLNKINSSMGEEKNSFTQANQYSVYENFQVDKFEQLDNVDFAFIFDFAQ
jgi:hypothetical protein